MPQYLVEINQQVLRGIWPLDVGCTCQAMGLFTILVNVILIGVVLYLLKKVSSAREDPFFPWLGIGFFTLLISEIIDWWQSMLIPMAGYLVFFPYLYAVQESLRVIGFLIIVITMFRIQREYGS